MDPDGQAHGSTLRSAQSPRKLASTTGVNPAGGGQLCLNCFLEFRPPIRRRYAPGAAHRDPVILVLCSANKAYLVILTIGATMRPGKSVRTQSFEEFLKKFGGHDYLYQWGSLKLNAVRIA